MKKKKKKTVNTNEYQQKEKQHTYVMTNMASNESSKGLRKSPTADKINSTIELKTDDAKSKTDDAKSIASPSVDQHDELNNTAADTKEKNLTSDTTGDCTSVEKNDSDNIKSENEDLKSLVIDKQDTTKTDKKQETQNVDSLDKLESSDKEKEVRRDSVDSKNSVKKGENLKRKRRTINKSTMVETSNSPMEESGTRGKKKKLKTGYDRFCWRCHKENVDACCTACPRSYHRKCIGGMPSSLDKWICGECVTILKAENAETCSVAMAQLSVDQLCMLLKHVVERLRDYPGSEPFCKAVDIAEVPNYLEYVIKPMDLSLLESNVRSKLYGSTDAFMADAKWIQHNCIVFNTCGGVYADTSKLTNAAKQIIKVARQEISEIDACPDCYAHGRNLPRPQPSWFIEPCRRPHPLVWAKLKGFPFWPAKAMPRTNSQGYVDVRFFGEHDRAWVSPKDLYLYSEEPPAPSPRKRKSDMDECVKEITRHCRKLALMFGQFKFAPPKIQYDPNNPLQIRLMLPNYNPLEPKNHLPNPKVSTSPKKKLPQKRQNSLKGKSQNDELTNIISEKDIDSISDACEKENEATSPKVQKLDIDVKNTSSSQTDLNSSNKLNKKADRGNVKSTPQEVAKNKMVKNGKSSNAKTSTSRLNVVRTETGAENSSTSPNISNNSTSSNANISNNSINPNTSANESNLQKSKNEVKSFIKILPKPANYSVTDTVAQKKTLLKNIINPKMTFSQMDNSKVITKYTRNSKAFKPKTRIVDKLNAEKELMSLSANKEDEKLSNSSKGIPRMSLLSNNKESLNVKNISEIDVTSSSTSNASVTHTITSTNSVVPITDKSVLLLVVPNGKSTESTKQVASTINFNQGKNEGHNSPQKAKKSFPRSPNSKNIQYTSNTNADGIMQISPIGQESPSTYQLLPPEAGPISARLHHDAHELARKMGHLMEEAYKEAAQNSINGENTDNYQATIFFLRKQIEYMKWQHQQQLAELKHNADRTLREMRASMEAEKLRSIEEVRKEVEDDKIRCIEETKKKQWCAKCGQQAMFYCCWNTAYCNYPCQESHWPTHMQSCSQQSGCATIVSSSANLNSQQTNYVIAENSTTKTYLLSSNMKLSAIPSASSLRNKTSQDAM
ncbi:PREDICTED: protein kinase C-binding protein 1 isoform X2 [Cyphomyrmex costatus]|uniref:Protein kinase C-binding protein 1 n=1 Tax=Cyphomyrmex costatus TaxID=456900 RepID=A0A195CBT2_9HYME|nr:PREDICTED: protein kinase C-binding protein 1 isoform X2 [Cyphomyrmex costatus]XP_018401156.1 PREDICTED: protein kinase C-binding protein 1 isoform X2 [Cyphomyrmex costatus]XP_018401157.1 PREDICTED: protein kinase C-binding protein 1 isoform X2 [Cyphomyrmex costatus]XP_018401158.1 PREDICTED: protein kinase C-binding protein 1 isoform X2 [Cyphomyrmex costatus]KYM97563.1 Protein kinase C-binding protein 1 [Cyphomyrmex costatus]